jgi:hypothetical protein
LPRLPTDQEFQARFNEYVRSVGGECVDDLLGPRSSGPKMADYLLWSRLVVAEMKCITTDQLASRDMGTRMQRAIQHGLRSGQIDRRHFSSGTPLPDGKVAWRLKLDGVADLPLRRKLMDELARPIKRLAAYASKQIRATANELNLSAFHTLLILVNLADRRLHAETVQSILDRVLRDHPSIQFVAFYSPQIGPRLSNGRTPTLWMTAMNGVQSSSVMERVNELMRGWLAFNEGTYLDWPILGDRIEFRATALADQEVAAFLRAARVLGYDPEGFRLFAEEGTSAASGLNVRRVTVRCGTVSMTLDGSSGQDWVRVAIGAAEDGIFRRQGNLAGD